MTRPVFETEGLTKSFGRVQALRGVDLCVRAGEIHAVLGHNGAGKSTLVKIVNGVHPVGSYGGTMTVDGEVARFRSPADARERGVGYVPQETQMLEHLSVAENIYVGQTGLERRVLVRFRQLEKRAAKLLGELGVPLEPAAPVVSLSAAQRQLVMVARALASSPSVLMLDEPTTSLSASETDRLFDVLRSLRAGGVSMVLITHRLSETMSIGDRATVLRDGATVAEFRRESFREADIVAAMVGRKMDLVYPRRQGSAAAEEALRVENLRVRHPTRRLELIRGVSLSVRRGEILGLAGLMGSGRTELLSAVYGRLPHSGRLFVRGREVRTRRPADARRAGIAMLTEDRRREGLLFNLPLLENMTIGHLAGSSRGPFVDRGREERRVSDVVESLRILTPSLRANIEHLSGGTQQKVLLGRVLMGDPRILLLDEPTKGVDVETKHEIYRLIVRLADRGVAILLVSSEFEELLGLCDRCLVLADGLVVDKFVRGEGSEERILRATTGTAGNGEAMTA